MLTRCDSDAGLPAPANAANTKIRVGALRFTSRSGSSVAL